MKIFIIFIADFQENSLFSWFSCYKIGNFQWIFDFSMGDILNKVLSYKKREDRITNFFL